MTSNIPDTVYIDLNHGYWSRVKNFGWLTFKRKKSEVISPELAQHTLDTLGYGECLCEDCRSILPTIKKALGYFVDD